MKLKGGQLIKLPFSYSMVNVSVNVNVYAEVVSIHSRTVVLKLRDDLQPFTGMKITVKKKELKALLDSEIVSVQPLSDALEFTREDRFEWE